MGLAQVDGGDGRGPAHGDLYDDGFWAAHLRAGLMMFIAGTTLGIMYLLLSPSAENRSALWAMVALSLASTVLVVILPRRAIVRSANRLAFFVTWSAFSCVFTAIVAAVDGGLQSPFAYMLFMPLAYAALAYPAKAVAAIGATATTAAAVVAVASHDPLGAAAVVIGTLAMAGMIATFAAHQRHAQAIRLVEMATHDGLTGCLNHRAFYERLDLELARASRHSSRLAVLLVDIDQFKRINDSQGHLAGDEVLRRVATALGMVTRATDAVGRVGGDEFAVVLVESGAAEAAVTADRICEAVNAIDLSVPVRVSVGVAAPADPTTTSAVDAVSAADRALYLAKGAA